MSKKILILLAFTVMVSMSGFALDIPSFDMKNPLGPEDPSMILAGIGGVGIAAAYLRSKFRK